MRAKSFSGKNNALRTKIKPDHLLGGFNLVAGGAAIVYNEGMTYGNAVKRKSFRPN
jgi:hypothetical protein